MKKLIAITGYCMLLACNIYAQELSNDDLLSIANSFWEHLNDSNAFSAPPRPPSINEYEIHPYTIHDTVFMYAINKQNSGWVMIANELCYRHVIAYSEEGAWEPDTSKIPYPVKCLLNTHAENIRTVRNGHHIAHSPQVTTLPESSYTIGTPLLPYNAWGQSMNNSSSTNPNCDKVYNKYCNYLLWGPCDKAYIGCSAVALAQTLWYWKWPDYVHIRRGADGNGRSWDINERTYYDWDNMPGYIYDNTPYYQANNVAAFLQDCKFALGTIDLLWPGSAAHINNFYQALDSMKMHYQIVAENDPSGIEALVLSEISQRRPVICQGWKNCFNGHTFVIDGFMFIDDESFYHINFGWLGSYNNVWFDIGFNEYDGSRSFVVELYPDCTKRNQIASNANATIVSSETDFTLYSTSQVVLGGAGHTISINNGGHLIAEAGDSIILLPGFHAESGSNVRLNIRDFCINSSSYVRRSHHRTTENDDKAAASEEQQIDIASAGMYVSPNPVNAILHIQTSDELTQVKVYTLNGQFVLQSSQTAIDVSALPQGMYILRALTADGQKQQAKFIKQ